jgi:hypothetical protein
MDDTVKCFLFRIGVLVLIATSLAVGQQRKDSSTISIPGLTLTAEQQKELAPLVLSDKGTPSAGAVHQNQDHIKALVGNDGYEAIVAWATKDKPKPPPAPGKVK